MNLTPAQKRALNWLDSHGPVGMFPVGGPSLSMIHKLEGLGLVQRAGKEPGMFGFVKYEVSPAGRSALRP